jgi:hypothetical protein
VKNGETGRFRWFESERAAERRLIGQTRQQSNLIRRIGRQIWESQSGSSSWIIYHLAKAAPNSFNPGHT